MSTDEGLSFQRKDRSSAQLSTVSRGVSAVWGSNRDRWLPARVPPMLRTIDITAGKNRVQVSRTIFLTMFQWCGLSGLKAVKISWRG